MSKFDWWKIKSLSARSKGRALESKKGLHKRPKQFFLRARRSDTRRAETSTDLEKLFFGKSRDCPFLSKTFKMATATLVTPTLPLLTSPPAPLNAQSLDPSFSSRYQIEHELGSGGFGFVLSVRRKSDSCRFACKFIHKAKMTLGFALDRSLGLVPLEVFILKNVHSKISFVSDCPSKCDCICGLFLR